MTEARYRGQKVIAVSPDEWLAPAPGTDGALAMAMGHVLLKELFLSIEARRISTTTSRSSPIFRFGPARPANGRRRGEHSRDTGDTRDMAYLPGKFLTADDLGSTAENANFKTVLIDARTGDRLAPNGSMGLRYGDSGIGHRNRDLAGVDPLLSLYGIGGRSVAVHLRNDSPPLCGCRSPGTPHCCMP